MYAVEATYDGGPILRSREDERWEFETVEEAAQCFESEANVGRYPLGRIVEDLAVEGEVEYSDPERGMTFRAFELAGAVA